MIAAEDKSLFSSGDGREGKGEPGHSQAARTRTRTCLYLAYDTQL